MQDDEMKTALHIAAENNYSEAIDAFYNSKMNSNITDRDGRTPLYTAAELGHVHSVQSITYYINPYNNAVDRDGKTPLYIAAYQGHAGCVRLLLACGASPGRANVAWRAPLYVAAQQGHAEVLALLQKTTLAVLRRLTGKGAARRVGLADGARAWERA